jgi:hypothetical protein
MDPEPTAPLPKELPPSTVVADRPSASVQDMQVAASILTPPSERSALGLAPVPTIASQKDFQQVVDAIEEAARNWGIRSDSLESKFVTALLGSTSWLGRLSESAMAGLERLLQTHRETAELELARAKEITKAANAALGQARNAQIAFVVQQNALVEKMIDRTLPLFAERLKDVLVIREKRLNADVLRRRYATVGLVTFLLVGGGYALRAWQEPDTAAAIGHCLANPLGMNGRLYCDVTDFAPRKQ